MNSYRARIAAATKHESDVANSLRVRGWTVENIGQGQIADSMRDALRSITPPTPMRWWPDLMACRHFGGSWQTVMVDAKYGTRHEQTGNHDVETAAVDAHEVFAHAFRIPIFYVFADGSVATPADFRDYATAGVHRGSGSGTPFLLLPTSYCKTFDRVFGERGAAAESGAA